MIVPGTDRLLEVDKTLGEACGGFRDIAADLGDVTGGLAGFADGVKTFVVAGVEAQEGWGEQGSGGAGEAAAAEIKLSGGREDGFELVEDAEDVACVPLNVSLELLLLASSLDGEIFFEDRCVTDGFVGGEQLAVDVEVADCAGSTSNLAEGTPELFELLRQRGQVGCVDEEFQRGFDAAYGGPEPVNGLGGGIGEALGHCSFEREGVAVKRSDGLWHEIPIPLDAHSGGCDRIRDTVLAG